MKKMTLLIIISFGHILLGSENSSSSNFDFLPLQVGNEWQFIGINPMSNDTSYTSFKVLTDTLMPNNKSYFEVENFYIFPELRYLRVDSIEEKVYSYFPYDDSLAYPDSEDVIFELNVPASGFYYTSWWGPIYIHSGMCKISFWPDSTSYYEYLFRITTSLDYCTITLGENIGFIEFTFMPLETIVYKLIAVRLNGQVYGNFVNISDPKSELIEDFILYQNYPNPFNSNTVIKFYHSKTEYLDLSIYNVQGQCIITLLKEEFPAGQKIISWDGKDANGKEISSGIYYYVLRQRNNLKCKRLLYIK